MVAMGIRGVALSDIVKGYYHEFPLKCTTDFDLKTADQVQTTQK